MSMKRPSFVFYNGNHQKENGTHCKNDAKRQKKSWRFFGRAGISIYSWGVTFFRVFVCVFWSFEKETLITVNNCWNFQKELEKMYDLNYSKCFFTCISFFKNWNLRYETYTPRGLISYFDQMQTLAHTYIYIYIYMWLLFIIIC